MPQQQTAPLRKTPIMRYVIPLALMVVIVGGITYYKLYSRSTGTPWNPVKVVPPPPADAKLVEFRRVVAQWSNQKTEGPVAKDVERNTKGHYDFLFRNTAGQDIEVAYFLTNCDCASVAACPIDGSAWEVLNEQQEQNPGQPLVYAQEPDWKDLVKQPDWLKLSEDARGPKHVLVKAGDGGAVRVFWNATKASGQALNVKPGVVFRLAADPQGRSGGVHLWVPVTVAAPVRFLPARVDVGTLVSGATAKENFYAFSATRAHLDLKLTPTPADPFFEVTATPLNVGGIFSRSQIGELQSRLKLEAAGPKLAAAKQKKASEQELARIFQAEPTPTVLAAQRVTVTVHETAGGRQLDLGSFYRKLEVTLDNIDRHDTLSGPEIVGRVMGIVGIGGAADERKVRIKDYSAKKGGTKTVELATDAALQLETYLHKPDWIKVELMRAARQPDPKRTIWYLTVTVPENTLAARSFDEPDAVTLRIVGTPERFVRIPIEGQLSGQ